MTDRFSEQAILFISLLEEEFDVEFPDEELTLDNLLSYSKISSTLDRLLYQKNGIDRSFQMTYLCNVIILLLTQNFIEMKELIKPVLRDEEEEVVE